MSDAPQPSVQAATVMAKTPPASDALGTVTPASADTPMPRYQLLDEIAHGGMGVIWRATDTTLGREVVLRPCLAAGRVRRRRRLIPDPAGRNRRATARFRRGMRIRGWE